jgi:chromate transport protein ChrA
MSQIDIVFLVLVLVAFGGFAAVLAYYAHSAK